MQRGETSNAPIAHGGLNRVTYAVTEALVSLQTDDPATAATARGRGRLTGVDVSDAIPTHRIYPQGVRPPARSEWADVLAALRTAPLHERSEFWSVIRDRIESDVAPEAPIVRTGGPSVKVPVVYYVRFGDRVKIGYTTNLAARLTAIPHDEVLATEPGTMQDERARHRQFADLRITGEWFTYAEPLVSHIVALR